MSAIDTIFAGLIIAAFAVFIVKLGMASWQTERYLESRGGTFQRAEKPPSSIAR